jgi:hypothetical protein
VGLFDLASDNPDFWQRSTEKSPNSAVLGSDNVLAETSASSTGNTTSCAACSSWSGKAIGFGVWVTLSKKNFAVYCETFDSGQRGALGPWFGWFSNRLKGYPDTLNLKCRVHPQPARQRPYIELEPTDHPLAIEQRASITSPPSRALALNGHDMRKSFTS